MKPNVSRNRTMIAPMIPPTMAPVLDLDVVALFALAADAAAESVSLVGVPVSEVTVTVTGAALLEVDVVDAVLLALVVEDKVEVLEVLAVLEVDWVDETVPVEVPVPDAVDEVAAG